MLLSAVAFLLHKPIDLLLPLLLTFDPCLAAQLLLHIGGPTGFLGVDLSAAVWKDQPRTEATVAAYLHNFGYFAQCARL